MSSVDSLATEIRHHLGPPPTLERWPLVSIVVLNHDGAAHLRRLMAGLVERTDYPAGRMELILVDNGSGDDSLELMREVEAPFPISILANPHNESFSDANNQGAELAGGELLLFLNNDIEPFEPGWLCELVACLRTSGAGSVGATLVYPDRERGSGKFRVQTRPFRLRGGQDRVTIVPATERQELLDEDFGQDLESVSVIGAALLIDRGLFWAIGGFTHGYFYGGEDEDLSMKLRERGSSVLYSGRSVLLHHVSSTSHKLHGGAKGALRNANSRLLRQRWGARAWREYQLG
ncbi:MAG: glycosyltransferase, partial [Dehalococcoidia bacterium]